MKKILLITLILFAFTAQSQFYYTSDANPIFTQVSFLNFYPDARGVGLGNTGVATSPDANSMFWNPAKLAFIEQSGYSDLGFTGSFNPDYVDLEKRFNSYASAYKTIGRQTIASSYKFHKSGEIMLTDNYGNVIGAMNPMDYSIDVSYAYRFTKGFSAALTFRYIYSRLFSKDIYIQGIKTQPGRSYAGDVSVFYTKKLPISSLEKCSLNLGLNISNIGSKMSYQKQYDDTYFIPTNLRLGTSFNIEQNDHKASFSFDLNKLLVPTNPVYAMDSTGFPLYENGEPVISEGKDPNVSVGKGMIQSFYDAPNGFKEEMQEIHFGLGLEYWYKKRAAFRTGYYYDHIYKGNRQLYNVGTGFRYQFFELDFTYSFVLNKNQAEFYRKYNQSSWFVSLILHFNTKTKQSG
ncbi:MAG: type IX secretion system outer membrane channel protein PorV [Bacteroidales bacterium]